MRAQFHDYRKPSEVPLSHGIMGSDALLLAGLGDEKGVMRGFGLEGDTGKRYIGFVDARSRLHRPAVV